MANYYASARTNYFKVRDAAAFRKMAKRFRLTIIEKGGLFGLLPGDWTDSGEFPSYDPDLEEQGLDAEIDQRTRRVPPASAVGVSRAGRRVFAGRASGSGGSAQFN